jgi:hypothetical protein
MSSTDLIHLKVFDRIYPLPRDLLTFSPLLSTALSGQYREQNEIDLEIDPIFKPAFNLIYNTLIGKTYTVDPLTMLYFGILSDYLGIEKYVQHVANII